MRELSPAPLEALEFYSPFRTTLVKAEESDGKWNVFLQASNEGFDQDKEKMLVKALQDQAQYYESHGVISWDHKQKQLHDPSFIIGEPTDVAFNAKNETLVKGILYKENKRAQGLWENLMSKSTRFGASVGGYILHKAQNIIDKVFWDETAITHKPVNDETLGKVQLMSFPEFAKALMAGAGVDASSFTGGRALTSESLQGNSQTDEGDEENPNISDADLRNLFNRFLAGVRRGEVKSTNDVLAFVLDEGYSSGVAADIVQFIFQKVPTLVGR
jgi:hypothetical protein